MTIRMRYPDRLMRICTGIPPKRENWFLIPVKLNLIYYVSSMRFWPSGKNLADDTYWSQRPMSRIISFNTMLQAAWRAMIFSAMPGRVSSITSISPNSWVNGSFSSTVQYAPLNLFVPINLCHIYEIEENSYPVKRAAETSHMWAAANHGFFPSFSDISFSSKGR